MSKSSSTNTTPHEAVPPIKQPTAILVKKPRSIWARIAMMLLIVTLVVGLVAGFLWVRRAYDKSTIGHLRGDVASLNARLEAAQTEHAALENRIAGMETVARIGVGNDEEQIKTAAKQYGSTFLKDATRADVDLQKRDGAQAVATVRSGEGKFNVYLKKTNDHWVAVWAGKSSPTGAQRSFYDLSIE